MDTVYPLLLINASVFVIHPREVGLDGKARTCDNGHPRPGLYPLSYIQS